jgi:hypothetical protein
VERGGCGVIGEEESGGGIGDAGDHDADSIHIAAPEEGKRGVGEARGRCPLLDEQGCCHGVWRPGGELVACNGGSVADALDVTPMKEEEETR